jgi:glycosyltransferase involved in cell wall biosynthesis
MSCGTPVVAFGATGLLDIIDHKLNGYLAKPFDTTDLANGIEWMLNLEKKEYNNLCKNAREKVEKEFDSKVVAKKYIKLYKDILLL